MIVRYHDHEHLYARDPDGCPWNSPAVTAEILGHLEDLLRAAGLAPPARLLEVGCGTGSLTLPLAQCGFAVLGVDVSPTAVRVARELAAARSLAADFEVADITLEKDWAKANRFDGIVDGLCLHCIIGDDRAVLLEALWQRLRPGGALCVITMCGEPRSERLHQRYDPATRCLVRDGVADRYLGRSDSLRSELRSAGFTLDFERIASPAGDADDQDLYLAVARRTLDRKAFPNTERM